jgi:DNA-binding NarL/FixJ family response regulator
VIVSKTTDVFLLAENRLLREALVRLLSKRNELRVVGSSAYSRDVSYKINSSGSEVVLLDSNALSTPYSSLIPGILQANRDLRIIMVDMDTDEGTFLRAVCLGVVGYVLKDASAAEVESSIRAVVGGEAVCPPALSMALFRSVAEREGAISASWGEELGLSRREQQLMTLLRERLTNKEIAARLNLSEQTVKNHVHHILRKTGAPSRSIAVARCVTASRLTPGIGDDSTDTGA